MATATKWVIDPMHSEVQFKVKHLVISTVTGFFKSFEGEMETTNDDFQDAEISFAINIDSIDTNQSQRDRAEIASWQPPTAHPLVRTPALSFLRMPEYSRPQDN